MIPFGDEAIGVMVPPQFRGANPVTNGPSAPSGVDGQEIVAAGLGIDSEAALPPATRKESRLREQMQARLGALRRELETGQAELQNVERRQIYLRETMLRISGAIQVLEELLMEGGPAGRNGTGPSET
jgi:hypothetical protein